LATGDLDGYRQSCTSLLERFGQTDSPVVAYQLARLCVLAPDAVADRMLLVQLAQKAAARDRKSYHTLGAAHYRAGEFDAAIQRLNVAIKIQPGMAADWLFLAMAHHGRGDDAEAKKWLNKAIQWIEQGGMQKTLSRAAQLETQLLRREAQKLIEEPDPNTTSVPEILAPHKTPPHYRSSLEFAT
jgi:tetratricopeptide (TPR) repeat protein